MYADAYSSAKGKYPICAASIAAFGASMILVRFCKKDTASPSLKTGNSICNASSKAFLQRVVIKISPLILPGGK